MFIDKLCIAIKEIIKKQHPPDIFIEPKNNVILDHILVKDDVSVVTDGKILIEIDNPKDDPNEFPAIEGSAKNIINKSVLLHKDTLTQIEKNIPYKAHLPILGNALVCLENEQMLSIHTTDLKAKQAVQQKIPEGTYPDYAQAYPQDKPVFNIRLSIPVLSRLIKTMSKINKDGVLDLTFYGDLKAVKFESTISSTQRKIKGLVMPMTKESK